jgi:hypothetical protein
MNSTMTYPVDLTEELHAALQDVAAVLARRLADSGGDRDDHAALARAHDLLDAIEQIG